MLSRLDYLLEARMPFLDGFLSGLAQSVIIEMIFWATIYLLYAPLFSRFLRFVLSKTRFWQGHVRVRSGVFCANAQDDTILLGVLMVHHFTAGMICWKGVQKSDATLWRHGYLLETGFELADLVALALSLYPYRDDNFKSEIMPAMVFHHLPGIFLSGVFLTSGMHNNEHLREIAFWLLVGAAFSCVTGIIIYNMNINDQLPQATIVFLLSVAFFTYCRFYVFPKEAYLLIQDVRADPELAGTFAATMLYVAGVCLALFNIGIMTDLVPKCVRYIKRNFDGVTPIEIDEVPLSREDRMSGRRRSSLFRAFNVNNANETAKNRRTSLTTLMGLNTIEDMYRLLEEEKDELEGEKEETGEKILLDPNDLRALRETIQGLKGENTKVNVTKRKII